MHFNDGRGGQRHARCRCACLDAENPIFQTILLIRFLILLYDIKTFRNTHGFPIVNCNYFYCVLHFVFGNEDACIMSQILKEVLDANKQYADQFGDKGRLPLIPARHFAILTCMDARLIPASFAGLSEGDAHVIRNAGGRASDDAIRSLVISYKLLGTREWFVIHHTDCGMQLFTDEVMGNLLEQSLETAVIDENGWHDVGHQIPGSISGKFIKWHTIDDLQQSVVDDVRRIREHPLVPGNIPIYGYIYEVTSGRLIEVAEATQAGAPTLGN
jgi:carbonic anhydrase